MRGMRRGIKAAQLKITTMKRLTHRRKIRRHRSRGATNSSGKQRGQGALENLLKQATRREPGKRKGGCAETEELRAQRGGK